MNFGIPTTTTTTKPLSPNPLPSKDSYLKAVGPKDPMI